MADLVVAEELLDTLASLDISVEAAGDTLQLVGPRSALSQELAEEIRRHKPEILAALRTRQSIGQALPGGVTEAQPSLLVASPELARQVAERIELGMLPDQSWRLELKKRKVRTTTGTEVEVSQVVWLGDATGRIRTREPRATFWRRLAATLLSWLPIEGQV